MIEASAVVSAVPPDRLARLVSAPLVGQDRRLAELDSFEFSPIIGVHMVFPMRILDQPHLVLPGRATQWIFDRGFDATRGHHHVQAVISHAVQWVDLSEQEIVRRVVEDVHAMLPAARGCEPIAARAVKERRATIALTPRALAIRPSAQPSTIGLGGGGVKNLFLAGDWCDTLWPATMESAVRSGYLAAEAITGAPMLVRDLSVPLFTRLAMRRRAARA